MKTFPTETGPTEPGPTEFGTGGTLLLFLDEAGTPGCWLRLGGEATAYGVAADGLPPAARTVLAAPGEQIALHWLELADGLTRPQAAAAARLLLADASAEPLARMHIAVGRPEGGRTPVALVPAERMSAWLAAAAAAGADPDALVPSPLLLAPPGHGFVRREAGAVSDYRGEAAAFTLEPELAEPLVAGAPIEAVDEARFEAEVAPILADLPLDLRQGPFARARRWRLEGRRPRRLAALAIALAVLTLAVQLAAILSFTFAADRARAEAEAIATDARGTGRNGPGFGAAAAVLFEAVRTTPNVELSRIDYRNGGLAATVTIDNPATLAALQARIEASGLVVEPGEQGNAGGRPTADLIVRPA